MYTAIQKIQEEFDAADLKYRVDQIEEHCFLKANVNGKASSYEFLFVKTDDKGNDVALRIFGLVKFPENKRLQGMKVLNELQCKYRFIRFTMNDEGKVSVEYDFPTVYEPIGRGAVEMLIHITKILDECYPVLMQSVWG